MTAWPTRTVFTDGPASTTMPNASLPGMCRVALSPRPNTGTGSPSAAKLVLKLGPEANTATSTAVPFSGWMAGAATFSSLIASAGRP